MRIFKTAAAAALLAAAFVATGSPDAAANVVEAGDTLDSTYDCTSAGVNFIQVFVPDDAVSVDIGDDGGDAAGATADAIRWTLSDGSSFYISVINCPFFNVTTGVGDEVVTFDAVDPLSSLTSLGIQTFGHDGNEYFDEPGNDRVTVTADAPHVSLGVDLGDGDDVLVVPVLYSSAIDVSDGLGADRVQGGAGDDFLGADFFTDIGTDFGPDRMFGRGGSDQILGSEGNDLIKAGGGNLDNIVGRGGDDVIRGGGGFDLIDGGPGNDEIYGQGHADGLEGGPGDDVINGGIGADTLVGGDGNDVVRGQSGPDDLEGNQQFSGDPLSDDDDQLFGGRGNDTITGDHGFDKCSGGLGDADEAEAATCEQTPGIEVLF